MGAFMSTLGVTWVGRVRVAYTSTCAIFEGTSDDQFKTKAINCWCMCYESLSFMLNWFCSQVISFLQDHLSFGLVPASAIDLRLTKPSQHSDRWLDTGKIKVRTLFGDCCKVFAVWVYTFFRLLLQTFFSFDSGGHWAWYTLLLTFFLCVLMLSLFLWKRSEGRADLIWAC